MMVKILFFATLKERAGLRETTLDLAEGTRISELKAILGERFPSLSPALGSTLVSINREYALDDDLIPADSEIALFPPVSGGGLVVSP
jgi:molybdopterin converting factor subunit 1